jgi:hypothetical protein
LRFAGSAAAWSKNTGSETAGQWPIGAPRAPPPPPPEARRRMGCGWRRCACLDAKTRVLAVGVLASTTYNSFIADLLFLSEVSHSLLVAGAPCVHPYLGKSALRGALLASDF